MHTLRQHGKTWELRTWRSTDPEVVVVSEAEVPMLHRRTCKAIAPQTDFRVLVDAHVPAAIREKTLALLWQVECEQPEPDRAVWFCEVCLMHEARVY